MTHQASRRRASLSRLHDGGTAASQNEFVPRSQRELIRWKRHATRQLDLHSGTGRTNRAAADIQQLEPGPGGRSQHDLVGTRVLLRRERRSLVDGATGASWILQPASSSSIGMIDSEDVLDGTVVRVPKAYPAYFGELSANSGRFAPISTNSPIYTRSDATGCIDTTIKTIPCWRPTARSTRSSTADENPRSGQSTPTTAITRKIPEAGRDLTSH